MKTGELKAKIEYLKILRMICIEHDRRTVDVLEAKAGRTVLKAREISTAYVSMRLELIIKHGVDNRHSAFCYGRS